MMQSGKKATHRHRANRSQVGSRPSNKTWLDTMRENKNTSAPIRKMQTKQTGNNAMQLTLSKKLPMPLNRDLKQSKEVINEFVSENPEMPAEIPD